MAEFYTNAFGWKTQQLGPEMGEYIVVSTTESDGNGRPKTPGAINGGFYQKSEDPLTHYPSVVISVGNINESIQMIKSNGGKVLNEPMPIPGVGVFASFLDTEGNRLSILQPIQM